MRSAYTERAASGIPNPTSLDGEVRFIQAQDQQNITTRSPRMVTECLLTRWMLIKMYFMVCAYILSQNYNTTVFHFDNISFLAHVLNQLFLPNESSISQASYCTMVFTICFQLFKKQPFCGGRVVEKNEIHGEVPVSDMRHAFRVS